MYPSLIQIGSKMAEKTLHKQTDKQTDRHYENNGHLAMNQYNSSHEFLEYISLQLRNDGMIYNELYGSLPARKS